MKLWIFVCVTLVLFSVICSGAKGKKRKIKKEAKRIIEELGNAGADKPLGGFLEANLTALWEKVNSMGSGVHIHVHGMDEDEPRMHHEGDGTHVHLHMHADDGTHGRRGHHGDHDSHEEDEHTEGYQYAVCRVQANSALPKEEQQPVTGNIFFRQKHDKHLEIKVHLEGFDMSGDHSTHVHGIHVHEFGDMSDGCQSMGGHFNPDGKEHGGPGKETRHCGDYGNIDCDENGVSHKTFYDHHTDLEGHYSVLGRSVIIHKNADDLGTETDAFGGAGARMACCVIVGSHEFEWDTIHGEHEEHNIVEDNDHHDHNSGNSRGHHGNEGHMEHKDHGHMDHKDHDHMDNEGHMQHEGHDVQMNQKGHKNHNQHGKHRKHGRKH